MSRQRRLLAEDQIFFFATGLSVSNSGTIYMHSFVTSVCSSGSGTAKYVFAWKLSKKKKEGEKDVKQKEFYIHS